jgi:hypothetical protein
LQRKLGLGSSDRLQIVAALCLLPKLGVRSAS